jgi:rhodanese-related sulfurtransferase
MKKSIYLLSLPLIMACGVKNEEATAVNQTDSAQTQSGQVCERIDKEKFKAAIKGEKIQLLDVRTPEEFAEGHIDGAVNINFFDADFSSQVTAKLTKDVPVYLYCRSGGRSAKALIVLRDLGYQTVYELEGGFMGYN